MAHAFPYTYISCPCSDASTRAVRSKRTSRDVDLEEQLEDEEKSFDPRSPRSAFSLFPPEHLLYCEECHELKCPRCVIEENITWYCPSCLFETPGSMARSEGFRCMRNCFNCPICTSQMVTTPIPDGNSQRFILSCTYCMWNTLEIGIKLDKPTSLRSQIDKIANGGKTKPGAKADQTDVDRKSSLSKEPLSPDDVGEVADPLRELPPEPPDCATRFNALKAFYKDQLQQPFSAESAGSVLDLPYQSPSSLARIMNLYTSTGNSSLKKSKKKPSVMREALTPAEGLQLSNLQQIPEPILEFASTATKSQTAFQYPSSIGTPSATSVADLRPMPTLLRTKKSKRCGVCRHILIKPETKPTSTRLRVKLVALGYIPLVTLQPVPVPGGLRPAGPDGADVVLEAGYPSQWILTLKNPLFENVRVSLGSPSVIPGKHGHKVTILCPQFEIGKDGDVWEHTLNNPLNKTISPGGGGGEQIAGKLYDQGRNWASTVIEISPVAIVRAEDKVLEEDEDVVEVPVRVRLEWKSILEGGDGEGRKKSEKVLDEGEGADGADDGSRELSYWMVLGIGRVAC